MTKTPVTAPENPAASTILGKIEAMRVRSLAMGRTVEPSVTVASGTPFLLPQWPDTDRGVPNLALRSSLFAAIAKGPRRHLERESISALKNVSISYTGEQLDQGDLDVWVTVVHVAKNHPIDQGCKITTYKLLHLMQLTDSGANRKTLMSRLNRLSTCALDVQVGPLIRYEGSLINQLSRDEHSRQLIIRLNPGLCKMLAADQFTHIHWEIRQSLNGHYLAQWLHGFYSSHAAPYPLKIETLRRLSGSRTTEPSKFRQLLQKALNALSRGSADHGQRFSYCFEGNLVKVEKTGSKAQHRHLNKRHDEKNAVTAGEKYRRSGYRIPSQ